MGQVQSEFNGSSKQSEYYGLMGIPWWDYHVPTTVMDLNSIKPILIVVCIEVSPPLVLHSHNLWATSLTSNPIRYMNMKHATLDLHLIWEQVEEGMPQVKHNNTFQDMHFLYCGALLVAIYWLIYPQIHNTYHHSYHKSHNLSRLDKICSYLNCHITFNIPDSYKLLTFTCLFPFEKKSW